MRGKARRWIGQLTLLYAFWWMLYLPEWLPFAPDTRAVIKEAVFGPLHLWYVVALIIAVAMIAVIRWLFGEGRAARRALFWIAVLCLLIGTGLHAARYFAEAQVSIHLYRNGPFMIFPFAALGYLLADRLQRLGADWVPSLRVGCLILLGLAVLRIGEAWLALILFGASYDAPPEFPPLAVAFSAMFVLVALRVRMPEPRVNLAFLAMLIYFLHFMVVVTALDQGVTNVLVLTALGVLVPAIVGLVMIGLGPTLAGAMPEALARRILRSDEAGQR